MAMHEINIDGAERNICHDCVDELWIGGKTEKTEEGRISHCVQDGQIRGKKRIGGDSDWGWRGRFQYSACCISSWDGSCLITGFFLVSWVFF